MVRQRSVGRNVRVGGLVHQAVIDAYNAIHWQLDREIGHVSKVGRIVT